VSTFGNSPLAQQSPIPLYYQVAKVLQARIFTGVYPPGSQIATEEELAKTFAVSRITVRKAIALLHEQGLIERRRPRGTFVAQHVKAAAVAQLHGFLEDLVLLGDIGRTLSCEIEHVPADAAVAARLGVPPGSPVTRISRVRSTGGSGTDAWIVNHVPGDVGRALDPHRLQTESLVQLLNETPGIRLADGFETLRACSADEETATRLSLPPGAPVLQLDRLLQTDTGRVVDFGRFYQRGDRVSYSVRLTRIWR
jgi:GntR family transcriptional regulator